MLGIVLAAFVLSFIYLKNSGKINKFKYVPPVFAAVGAVVVALNYERAYRLFWENGLSALQKRGEIWYDAVRLFLENPLFGVGPSVCCYSVQKFSGSSMVDAHNFLLQKFCDLGIVGTFIYLMPIVLLLGRALKATRSTASDKGVASVPAMGYAVIFVIVSVFSNSSLSPHYILPALSLFLYLVLGLFVGMLEGPKEDLRNGKRDDSIRFFSELMVIAFISSIIYLIFKVVSIMLVSDIYFELTVWQKTFALFMGIFIYSFYFSEKLDTIEAEAFVESVLPAPPKHSTNIPVVRKAAAIATIFIAVILAYPATNYFIAEKANNYGMLSVSAYSMKKSFVYFDIAISHDPTNVSYLINKSYALFISGFVKNRVLKGNSDFREALVLMDRAHTLCPDDELIRSAQTFLDSKFNGNNDYKTLASDRKARTKKAFNADINQQILVQTYFNAFSKFVDIFGDDGYSVFLKTNDILRKKILDIMYEEKDIKQGTKLEVFFDYISFCLKIGVNVDFPGIDKFLITGVYSTMKGVEVISKFIPVSGFRQHSVSYNQQNEMLAAVSVILPVIWKYSYNLDSSEVHARYLKMFGSDDLFPIVDYFVFRNDAAAKQFERYPPELRDYLESMVCFSNGSFEAAVSKHEAVFKKYRGFSVINSVLMSWIYYKSGDLAAARDITLYCQTHTLNNFKRDLTFKRDILFGGNMHAFYYLPLQAYYNEYIMLALIRLNGGDHTQVIQEIFKYLRAVIYVE